jgi:hypothetical protein
MRHHLVCVVLAFAACGKGENSGSSNMTFRQMHEAAVAQRGKGASLEAAARPFVGQPVELDAVAGESQSGICSRCYEMQFEDIKFIATPHADLDPIKFGIFVEGHAGKKVHVKGTIAGGAPGFVQRSPLAVEVQVIGE